MVPIIQSCGRCGREVYHAEKKIALNKVWHDFCFNCVICEKRLNSQNFNSHRGELFCDSCYTQAISFERIFDNHQSDRRMKSCQSSCKSSISSEESIRRPRAEIVEMCNVKPSEIKNAIRSRRKESLSVINEDRSSKVRRRMREDYEDSKPWQYYNRHRRNAISGVQTCRKEICVSKSKKINPPDKIISPVRQGKKKIYTEDDSVYETEPRNVYKKILPSYLCKGEDCTCPKNAVYSEFVHDSSFPKTEEDSHRKPKDKTNQKLIKQLTYSEELYKSDRSNTPQRQTPEEIEEILFVSDSGTTKIVKKTCNKKGKYKKISQKTAPDDTTMKKYNEDCKSSLRKRTVKVSEKETKKKKSQRNFEETVKNLSNLKKTDEFSKKRNINKPTNEDILIRPSIKVETHNTTKDNLQRTPKNSEKPQRNTKEDVLEAPLAKPVEKSEKTVERSWFFPKFNLFNRNNPESFDKLKVIEETDEYMSKTSGETKRLKSLSSDSILTKKRRNSVKNSSLDSRYKSQKSLEYETIHINISNQNSKHSKEDKFKSSNICETSDSKNCIKKKVNINETVQKSDSYIQKHSLTKKNKNSKLNEAAQNVTRKSKTPETDKKNTKDKIHTKTTSNRISYKVNLSSSVKKKQQDEELAHLDEFITLNMKYTPQIDYNRKIKNNEYSKKITQKSSRKKKQADNASLDADILKPIRCSALKIAQNEDLTAQEPNIKNIFKRIPKVKSPEKELFTTVYNIYPDSKEDMVKTLIKTVRTLKITTNIDNEDNFKCLPTPKNKNSLAPLNSEGKFVVTTEICPKTKKATAEVLPTKCVTKTCTENKETKKQSVLNSGESKNLHNSNKKSVANTKKPKTLNADSQSMITKRILSNYASKCDKEEKSVEKLRNKRFFEPVTSRAKSGASNMVVHPWQENGLDAHESLFNRPTIDSARGNKSKFDKWTKKDFELKKEEDARKYICKRCNQNVFIVERIFAGNEVFHMSCYCCYICKKHLDSLNVLPRQGEIYCKQCYMKFFGPHTYGFGLCPNLYC